MNSEIRDIVIEGLPASRFSRIFLTVSTVEHVVDAVALETEIKECRDLARSPLQQVRLHFAARPPGRAGGFRPIALAFDAMEWK
ncbi:hypothetical protein N2601_31255 (plasmid) [Rhizobium sp. CB3060]|uniref:hypothetical protein n=1 Tax=Rhizobium sp. CB3060 TaxID=3138255 RepID=UPI0021A47ADF|nr:hypothetical protein [Rhizobium tropici]UWU25463.1 hypothetical protein N2601_31255 [Rhizobium tropici]